MLVLSTVTTEAKSRYFCSITETNLYECDMVIALHKSSLRKWTHYKLNWCNSFHQVDEALKGLAAPG